MELNESENLLYNKRNGHQIEKVAQIMGENVFQLYICNYQNVHGAQKFILPQNQ
jgi:hypothetical protein